MAQGRMLRKDICESDSFTGLNDTKAQLLCCLLTPWWDDHGKMIGDPQWIKGNIVRKLKQFTEKEIIRCLELINKCLDVQWWTDEKGNKWLYWGKFNNHQTISKEKMTKDNLPSPKIPKNPQKTSVIREVEVNISRREGAGAPLSDEDFIKTLKTNPAYKHIDIDRELAKMDAWLLTHQGRQKTRRFIVKWLNRIETPLRSEIKTLKEEKRPEPINEEEHKKVSKLIHETALKMKGAK